ncbi:CDP-glycerol glycerophosphotransferase family protein [Alteribacter aurantiacus]|uniref:CDP-glycerol glycerophosphotransferase family protein n=1 Tax=Alteribacter aurantiacus TaxID=254410 RepID=UPI00041F241B|nr:CDP-glycerol glycerophosphotransferase family protein [Alteribacter aurantiacus]
MGKKLNYVWLHSVDFLHAFSPVTYDSVPIALPLLREFQKYIKRNRKKARALKRKVHSSKSIQQACTPYLINHTPLKKKGGSILVRAEMASPVLEKKSVIPMVFLAHKRSEYKKALANPRLRPLYYLPKIKEKAIPSNEQVKVLQRIKTITSSPDTPPFLKTNAFKRWIQIQVITLMKNLRRMHTLFDKHTITTTFYGSTLNRHGGFVTSFAQTRRAKTINYQHGLLGDIGHLPSNADLHLVWGPSHVNYLVSNGVPKKKVKIATPVFVRSGRAKVSARKHKKKQILVAMQPLGKGFNRRMIRRIEGAAKGIENRLQLNIKLHPDHHQKSFRRWTKGKSTTVYPHGSIPLNQLIQEADLVITPYSTVGYEAMLVGKPVVFYTKKKQLYFVKGPLKRATSRASLHTIFLSVLANKVTTNRLKVPSDNNPTKNTPASFLL